MNVTAQCAHVLSSSSKVWINTVKSRNRMHPMAGSVLLVLWLNNKDVSSVLTMPMCLQAIDSVYEEIARGDAVGMGRIDMYVPSGEAEAPFHRWSVMTGGSRRDGFVCARMLSDMVNWPSQYEGQRETKYAGKPGTYCGLLFLYSVRDGTPVAIINDGALQHMRVGASAGLGVKYLSRKDSHTVGMLGSGGMARAYIEAFTLVRDIRKVKVYSPNPGHVRKYAAEIAHKHELEVEVAGSARKAVEGVDIVSLCTSSTEPVFRTEWLEQGMHIADVIPPETEKSLRAKVDVAVRAGDFTPELRTLSPETFHASHTFLAYVAGQPEEKSIIPRRSPRDDILSMPTMADLFTGKIQGRISDWQTTWFQNLGSVGQQFETVAAAAYRKAVESGVGMQVPTEWFLQDIRD